MYLRCGLSRAWLNACSGGRVKMNRTSTSPLRFKLRAAHHLGQYYQPEQEIYDGVRARAGLIVRRARLKA